MRYDDLEIESLLKVARAARELERNAHSVEFSATDTLIHLANIFGQPCGLSLIEAILDHEDRLADFGNHWRRWRRLRAPRAAEEAEE